MKNNNIIEFLNEKNLEKQKIIERRLLKTPNAPNEYINNLIELFK